MPQVNAQIVQIRALIAQIRWNENVMGQDVDAATLSVGLPWSVADPTWVESGVVSLRVLSL